MTLGDPGGPGRAGADIAVGDVQVFGNAPSFGGPSAGFLACREAHVRQIPGRLVGQTVDEDGRTCYTLTLQAREQHIRRAKATSNICSNQALSALAATIHLALLGPQGLRELGLICLERAHYLHAGLCALPGVKPLVEGPFFHEFALRLPCAASSFVSRHARPGRGSRRAVRPPASRAAASAPAGAGGCRHRLPRERRRTGRRCGRERAPGGGHRAEHAGGARPVSRRRARGSRCARLGADQPRRAAPALTPHRRSGR